MLSRFEIRRFRGLLPVLALLFAMSVPVIYGAIYLYANWDPYGHLKNLPVAIVNTDAPATVDGEQVTAGADVERELIQADNFAWRPTTQADADAGLVEGRYYLVMTIPSDFSANLVSAQTSDPQRAQITLRRNDANGFVIGSVTNSAQGSIERAVDKAAVDAYFRAVFKNLDKIRTGMKSAADGSQQLTDGLTSAKSGSAQLGSGLASADSGAGQLADGAHKLNDNMPALVGGANDLKSGLDQLNSGSATLASGAHQVADGTQQLNDTVIPVLDKVIDVQTTVATDVAQVNAAIQKLNGTVNGKAGTVSGDLTDLGSKLDALATADPTLASSQQYADARAALTKVEQRASTIESTSSQIASDADTANGKVQSFVAQNKAADAKSKLTQLNDGAHQVATGADSLHAGIGAADTGAGKLATGVQQVSDAVGQLSTGASALKAGLDRLAAGASELDAGLAKLVDGSTSLSAGLSSAVQQIPALTADQQDKAAIVLSSPADVTMDVLNPAHVYGRGLAPLFFSIAMWVFGISGFLVMRPITGRLLAGRLTPLRLAVAAWVPIGAVGLAGALAMLAVVWFGIGLDPVNPWATVGLVVLASLVFSGIAHLLRMALGLPGSALLLIWLILQLSATGGTYPVELLPPFFQWIHPFMPITYTIDAFRIAISGGEWSRFVHDAVVLVGIGVAALVLDALAVMGRQRFRISDLHPPLQH